MPVGINQPSNQIKFTNVSIVRLKKGVSLSSVAAASTYTQVPRKSLIFNTGKKRFELACYKNKLLEYRSGAETDLDNVLQIPTVFLSVSKAQTAPSADLSKAFGPTAKREDIIQEILKKGEVQVGERERKELLERVEREVLDLVSARLVDPVTKRVYTTGMIGKALDQLSAASGQQQGGKAKGGAGGADTSTSENTMTSKTEIDTPVPPIPSEEPSHTRKPLWTGVVATKSAKSQALDAMKALIAWQPIPVMRARMQLRITCPTSVLKQAVRSSNGDAGQQKSGTKGKGRKGKKGDDSEDETLGGNDHSVGMGTGTVKDRILSYFEQVESQQVLGADEWEVTGFAEPGAFKGLSDFVGGETKGRGRVEVLEMAVTHEE